VELTHVTTCADDAVARLRTQFQLPNIIKLVRAIIGSVQDAEDAGFSLAGARFLDNATFATLDLVAAMYDVMRLGMDDSTLRSVVRGAIAAQRSQTTLPETRNVAAKLFYADQVFIKQPDSVDVPTARPACVAVGLGGARIPTSAYSQSVTFLQSALPAGVALARVFLFPKGVPADFMTETPAQTSLALVASEQYATQAIWVGPLSAGGLADAIYQNPAA
jgi:hypothetical protein